MQTQLSWPLVVMPGYQWRTLGKHSLITNDFLQDIIPHPPDRIRVLCCPRLAHFDFVAHLREMEWAPARLFETNTAGVRVQTGWRGEWSCNQCGRSVTQNDPLVNWCSADSPTATTNPPNAPDEPQTLVVDAHDRSRTWLCMPNSSHLHHETFLRNPVPQPTNLFTAPPPTANHEETLATVVEVLCVVRVAAVAFVMNKSNPTCNHFLSLRTRLSFFSLRQLFCSRSACPWLQQCCGTMCKRARPLHEQPFVFGKPRPGKRQLRTCPAHEVC